MIIFWALTLPILALLALSHGGRWHPAGDAFAVIRPALAGLAGGLLAGGALLQVAHPAFLLLPVFSLITILWPIWRPQPTPSGSVTLYQKNLCFQLGDPAVLLADIRACDPDVITLQEVSVENRALLAALADRWPHQHICSHVPVGAVAVLSRHAPVPDTAPLCAPAIAGLRITAPSGPLWVISLHLPWPWPFKHALYRAEVLKALATLTGPCLLAGDFNMVPWSFSLATLSRSLRGQRAGRAHGTFPMGRITLPIDHCIAPTPARTERRPLCGSDHHGLLARM